MKKHWMATILFIVVLLLFVQKELSLDVVPYIHDKDESAAPAASSPSSLFEQVEKAADSLNEPPVDAVVDKVWKAVPGYNGKMVDTKASYEKMKRDGSFDERKLVFEEVSPEVHLEDLPPTPVYKGNAQKPMVSFLINVSWGEDYLPSILKTLREEKVKATFFLEGRWVQKNPKLAKMIKEEGHEIGSHAYSHPDLSTSSRARIKEELQKTNEALAAVLSVEPRLFAPPSGSFNQETVDIAHDMGMYTILWTVDTIDWKNPEPMDMAVKTASKVENGSMILMHPTASTAGGLKEMIRIIKEKNLQIDTVTHLLDETRMQTTSSSTN
ncbi:probable sporulation protein, polysaccharide deacetylase family [Alteribacillus persepolensis]|uniref:Probable sporulation protein, polysaccharide deacetylase family n=1 Tax=Alteribacillus persepolensis TaxID=568899 RepID=A0A1G7YUF9_9BACI|nr:polysaccharide deacetylase family protein [Alteribacillus persepolensis]SDG99500.1 probable sporulation protein, polysaccharide deacetylase family [Alteribacillus persepolensis]